MFRAERHASDQTPHEPTQSLAAVGGTREDVDENGDDEVQSSPPKQSSEPPSWTLAEKVKLTESFLECCKALEDPANKLKGLAKVGVIFTAGQVKQVKALVATGHALDAQKLILAEFEKRVGGAAKAAGDTLGGQLKVLRNRFADLAASGIGLIAPAVAKAVAGLTDFVRTLSEVHGFRAKVEFAVDAGRGLVSRIERAVGDAVSGVDWDKVWANARGIADGLQKRLDAIDFGKIGERIGDGISAAVKVAIPAAKELATRIGNVLGAIDFVKLGKAIGPGLAAAIVTAFVTLTDPAFWVKNWDLALAVALTVFGGSLGKVAGKLAIPFVRLGGDLVLKFAGAFERFGPKVAGVVLEGLLRLPGLVGKALAPLVGLVGRAFGRLSSLARFTVKVLGIQAVIDAVANLVQRVGQVLAPVGAIIGNAFTGAFHSVVREAIKTALALIEPFSHLPKALGGGPFQRIKAALKASLDGMVKDTKRTSAAVQDAIDKLHGKTITLNVKTTLNGKSGEAPLDLGQVALARAAATKKAKPLDTALGLTDAAGNAKKAADIAAKALQRLLDTLNLAVSKATLTKTFKDDLAANQALIVALREQIRLHKDDLSLQQDLVSAQQARVALVQQQKDAEAAARNAKQFRSLGLDETGQALVPLKKGLARQLAKVTADITGSFLDTGKTQKVLAAIRKLVLNPFTKVSKEVRSTVKQMLDDIEGQLKNGIGTLTKFHKQSSNAILAGLGLSPEQVRALRSRLSQVGADGTVPGRGQGAFGFAVPGGDIVVNTSVNLDGRKVASNTTKHQQRRSRRNPPQKRGPHAGT